MDTWIKGLPKIDLHCHLDGSLPLDFLEKAAGEEKIFSGNREELRALAEAPEDCGSLEEYLKRFSLPVACLQKARRLREAACGLLREAALENTVCLEARFAPSQHLEQGLSLDQAVESVLLGLKEGREKYGVEAPLILCVMRHQEEEMGFRILETAESFLEKGVAALDLAGAEAAFPVERFARVFREAKRRGVPFTIHAGEAAGPESVRRAVELGAARIGHGLAAVQDRGLLRELAARGTVLELCPSSNLQTGAAEDWDSYPLEALRAEGVKVTVNTDNRTVTGTTMTRELGLAQKQLGLGKREIMQLCRWAAEGSFAGPKAKERLAEAIEEYGK